MATHEEDWLRYSEPNAEWAALDTTLMLDLTKADSVQEMRDALAQLGKKYQAPPPNPRVRETDHRVAMRDGHEITLRVYAPKEDASAGGGGRPLVYVLHGGGFCIGGLEVDESLCRRLADELGFVAVNVDYRLAPDYPFPVPVNDAWDALQWVAENASSFGADLTKGFIVAGTSAGGNIAAVVGHQARDHHLSPPLTGLLLMIPSTMSPEAVPDKYRAEYRSCEQNKDAPILNAKARKVFSNAYKPDPKSELYNVFNWPSGHANLPPTYFQVCGLDPLRDEALLLERVMRVDDGVKTKLSVYGGLPHGFWMTAPQLQASKDFVADSFEGLKWMQEFLKH